MKASELSINEKARLVNGISFFGMYDPVNKASGKIQLLDGGTGINFEQLFGDIYETSPEIYERFSRSSLHAVIENYYTPDKYENDETELAEEIKKKLTEKCGGKEYSPGCFPPGILLGASWDPETVYETGKALGKEAAIFGIDILLGTPNINILRDPLAGRLFEGYSEDPYLVSSLAPELVKGVQEYGVAANVKHFAANNQEMNRVGINETISRRALEEIYLPGFRACVTEGKARTVMSAYNKINGVPCTESRFLLTQKLKEEWGSDAAVMSDWGAVSDQISSLKAGNALKMPGPSDPSEVIKAIENGSLTNEELDCAADDLIKLCEWINTNSRKKELQSSDFVTTRKETDLAAYKAAAEGIVLLENQNKILPLGTDITRIALAGSGADNFVFCGSGSARVITDRMTDLRKCLHHNFPSADLTVSPENADVTVFICTLEGAEGNDRKNMYLKREDISELYRLGAVKKEALPDEFKDIVSAEPEKKCSDIILVLNICGPADLSFIDRNTVKAVLCTFIPGMQGPAALADILCGKINPSGKLPVSFPEKYEQCPSFINFPGDGYEVCYGEGIFNGYKYYDTKKIRPLYRFGYGLSYTEFSIGKINDLIIEKDIISFCINAENTGKYSGSEVIQIYISDPFSTLRKPEKELKAFRKLFLKPGEIKTIRFEIPLCSLSSFDSDLNKFTVEEGYYNITAAVSSDPSDAADTKQIYIDTESPYSFGINSSVKTIYENHELYSIFRKFWNNAGYDPTIPNANYQYTPSRKISDIIRDADIKAELSSDTVTKLNSELKRIKKN